MTGRRTGLKYKTKLTKWWDGGGLKSWMEKKNRNREEVGRLKKHWEQREADEGDAVQVWRKVKGTKAKDSKKNLENTHKTHKMKLEWQDHNGLQFKLCAHWFRAVIFTNTCKSVNLNSNKETRQTSLNSRKHRTCSDHHLTKVFICEDFVLEVFSLRLRWWKERRG